jgi:uncharacterized protein (DUF1810 family)
MTAPGLERFVEAQKKTHERAKKEMMAGHKTSHWIWWTLPQIQKLEVTSENNIFYAIKSLEEARAYLDHPILGKRLVEMAEIILTHRHPKLDYLMGKRCDVKKLQSCMTLFEMVSPPGSVFEQVLTNLFAGVRCPITIAKMGPTL